MFLFVYNFFKRKYIHRRQKIKILWRDPLRTLASTPPPHPPCVPHASPMCPPCDPQHRLPFYGIFGVYPASLNAFTSKHKYIALFFSPSLTQKYMLFSTLLSSLNKAERLSLCADLLSFCGYQVLSWICAQSVNRRHTDYLWALLSQTMCNLIQISLTCVSACLQGKFPEAYHILIPPP